MRTRALSSLMLACVALPLWATGCAELELGCDDLSGMVDGSGGLTVTEQEHPTGWGHGRCQTCHSVERIHVQNCTGLEEVDIAAIRTLVDEQGTDSCAACHGDNGVTP